MRACCQPFCVLPAVSACVLPRYLAPTPVHQPGCLANKYQSRPEYVHTGQISPSHEPQLLELLTVFVIVCMFVCCHVENVCCYYALLCLFSSWCLLISVNIPVHHTYLTHRFVSFRIVSLHIAYPHPHLHPSLYHRLASCPSPCSSLVIYLVIRWFIDSFRYHLSSTLKWHFVSVSSHFRQGSTKSQTDKHGEDSYFTYLQIYMYIYIYI
mgnify:CR=1 FL=1